MEKERITENQRMLASKMIKAQEARKRVEDLKERSENDYERLVELCFDNIHKSINKEKLEASFNIKGFSRLSISRVMKILSEMGYNACFEDRVEFDCILIEIEW